MIMTEQQYFFFQIMFTSFFNEAFMYVFSISDILLCVSGLLLTRKAHRKNQSSPIAPVTTRKWCKWLVLETKQYMMFFNLHMYAHQIYRRRRSNPGKNISDQTREGLLQCQAGHLKQTNKKKHCFYRLYKTLLHAHKHFLFYLHKR